MKSENPEGKNVPCSTLLGAPTRPGNYTMYCAEANYEPTLVRVFEQNGSLMVDDPHIGNAPLADYHAGLTEIRWERLSQNAVANRKTGND